MERKQVNLSQKKMILLASLGLVIPIFLISMAFLAVKSDAKNQEKYKQQQADILKRIEAKEAESKKVTDEPKVETISN